MTLFKKEYKKMNIGKYVIFNIEKGWAGKIIEETNTCYIISVPTRFNEKDFYVAPKKICVFLKEDK